jgi:cell wall-associated NlpC family hydrolase
MHQAPPSVRLPLEPSAAGPSRRRPLWWGLVGLTLVAGGACAAPPPDDDPMGRYLQERGLVAAQGAPIEASAPSPTLRDQAAELVLTALNYLDLPYRRGGNSADAGFDCSGFTRHIFQLSLGLVLPRRVDEQASAKGLVKVARDQLEPGDLVFFNTLRRTFSHVGIYIGGGKFIHAPRTGGLVRMEDMRLAYWSQRFTGGRRSPPAAVPQHSAAAPETAPQAALLSR